MKKISFFFLLFITKIGVAQDQWSLQQCIEYAVQHNISIQQSQLNAKTNAIQIKQNKYSQYPTLNADVSNGYSVGRSIDPTSNTFINQGYYYNGFNVGSNVLLFGWFTKKYQNQQAELNLQTNIEQYKQLQNDIALNIATGYLRVLLAREQLKINEAQLQTDAEQYQFTRKRVDAGAMPELNAAQLYAQVVNDSTNIITSNLDINSALLDLKALLNLDMQTAFEIQTPNLNYQELESLINYPNAEEIFKVAKTLRPLIKANDYKIKSAQKQVEIAKTSLYPQITLGFNIGTNFASTVKKVTSYTYKGEEVIGNVTILDSLVPVTRPSYNYNTSTTPLFQQYGNNMRESISLGTSIPIFNGYTNRFNIERAKLNVENAILVQDQEVITLKQNVYKAYNDAQTAIQKHKASINNVQATQVATDFAIKRYNAGMLNTQDYTIQQNNLTKAKINSVLTQYDLIFKLKILDFYLGKNIQL